MKYDTNTHMENLEMMGDAQAEVLADLEAQKGEEVELVEDDELKQLLQEIWEEEAELAMKREEEEYTEREAFDDFYANQEEDWN